VIVWQVACEFIAASRKLGSQGFTAPHAWRRLAEFLDLLRLVLPSPEVFPRAQSFHLAHNVSFWDAMILAACLDCGAAILYSEDAPGLDALGALKVVNPFE
jgi:predicted nucleic acid-binding protein